VIRAQSNHNFSMMLLGVLTTKLFVRSGGGGSWLRTHRD
jgi:hypothetical protein